MRKKGFIKCTQHLKTLFFFLFKEETEKIASQSPKIKNYENKIKKYIIITFTIITMKRVKLRVKIRGIVEHVYIK